MSLTAEDALSTRAKPSLEASIRQLFLPDQLISAPKGAKMSKFSTRTCHFEIWTASQERRAHFPSPQFIGSPAL